MLTEKDYCDYETCVALKKLGYKEKTLAYYTSERIFYWRRAYIYDKAIPDLAKSSNKELYKHVLDAVSIYEAQKWLREEKKLFVEITIFEYTYGYRILDTQNVYYDNEHVVRREGHLVGSYEEALAEGVREATKILKEE